MTSKFTPHYQHSTYHAIAYNPSKIKTTSSCTTVLTPGLSKISQNSFKILDSFLKHSSHFRNPHCISDLLCTFHIGTYSNGRSRFKLEISSANIFNSSEKFVGHLENPECFTLVAWENHIKSSLPKN